MRLIAKNWSQFQHYKDRNPPWIRLHKRLLDDMEFQMLPDASRALAPMLWLLASESMDGSIDGDVKKLAFRLRHSPQATEAALKPLIDSGFFVPADDASAMLASRLRDAVPETETETETDNKLKLVCENSVSTDSPSVKDIPPCPHQEILELWAIVLPELPQPNAALWEGTRAGHLKARWRALSSANGWRTKDEGLNDFKALFGFIRQSDFLMGRTETGKDRKPFELTIDWLVCPNNWTKVLERKYHTRRAA